MADQEGASWGHWQGFYERSGEAAATAMSPYSAVPRYPGGPLLDAQRLEGGAAWPTRRGPISRACFLLRHVSLVGPTLARDGEDVFLVQSCRSLQRWHTNAREKPPWTRHQCEILVIQGYDCLHAFQQGFMQLTFPTSGQHEAQHYITIFSIHNENSHVVTMTSPPAAVERGQLAGRRGRSCSGGAPRSYRTLVNHHYDDQRQPSPPPARPPLPPRLPASTTRGALKVTPPPLLLPSAP